MTSRSSKRCDSDSRRVIKTIIYAPVIGLIVLLCCWFTVLYLALDAWSLVTHLVTYKRRTEEAALKAMAYCGESYNVPFRNTTGGSDIRYGEWDAVVRAITGKI